MTIAINCPTCDADYHIPDYLGGRTLTCKACGSAMSIPAPLPLELPWHHHPVSVGIFWGTLVGGVLWICAYESPRPGVDRPLMDPSMFLFLGMQMGFYFGLVKAAMDGLSAQSILMTIFIWVVIIIGFAVSVATAMLL